jgi:cytochrome d ubiquinol oxidase subunit II
LYLALRTSGELEVRAQALASKLSVAVLILTALSVPATVLARPTSMQQYITHPIAFLAPGAVLASLLTIFISLRRWSQLNAFLASCAYLGSMLVGAAAGLFPVLLPSVGQDGHDITIANSLAGSHTLHNGLVWWTFGILLAIGYSITVFWLFRGKVPQDASGYGH